MVAPLVINRPMPRKAVKVASVMMKGGSPSCTMPKPWKVPIAAPISERQQDRRGRSVRRGSAARQTITLAKPTTAPTDRSMPAVMITKV